MERIKCFWLESTDQISMSLRRFTFSSNNGSICAHSGYGYHNASVDIGQANEKDHTDVHGDSWDHADPRWPTKCSCGYQFKPEDQWQFNPDSLYRRTDTGELMTARDAPPGAMLDAMWLRDFKDYKKNPDGIYLNVKLPGDSWWCVDGPSYNNNIKGPGWTRMGTIPDVTARPSILTPNYHGWLTNGYLIKC